MKGKPIYCTRDARCGLPFGHAEACVVELTRPRKKPASKVDRSLAKVYVRLKHEGGLRENPIEQMAQAIYERVFTEDAQGNILAFASDFAYTVAGSSHADLLKAAIREELKA